MLQKRKGFTLIEVAVVLGVITVVLSLMAPSTKETLSTGRRSSSSVGVNALVIAIGQYYFETETMPKDLNDLTIKQEPFGPWATSAALKDVWNNPYNYAIDPSTRLYAVWSHGANKTNESGGGVPSSFTGDDVGTVSQY